MAVFRIDQFSGAPAAANALRERLARIGSGRRMRLIDPRLIRLTEFILVIAIGLLLASIFWSVFGPMPRPSSTPRPSAAAPEAAASGPINPFRIAAVAEAEELPSDFNGNPELAETTLNLVLHGTWLTPEGGAAFIKTQDDKQGRFGIGDTITNGVTLEKVYRDQVVINRGGVRESLRLINREQPAAGVQSPSAPSIASEPGADGMATIGQYISARPEIDDVGNMRLVLQPAGDVRRFASLGLRPGDKLVAVDNEPLSVDSQRNMELIAGLGGKRAVTISIERDGVVMPVTVPLSPVAGDAE